MQESIARMWQCYDAHEINAIAADETGTDITVEGVPGLIHICAGRGVD